MIISLSTNHALKPTTLWRLNNSLLNHPRYQVQIKSEIMTYFQMNTDSILEKIVLWNTHKCYMRGFFIKIGAHEKSLRAKTTSRLLDKIRAVEESNKSNPIDHDLTKLGQLWEELVVHVQKYFDFHIRRLRLNGYAYSNKPGAELAKQLKRKITLFRIANMKTSLGQLVCNPKVITNCFSQFYFTQFYFI